MNKLIPAVLSAF